MWSDFRGSGIRLAASDDGFDTAHADIRVNYDTARDRDFVSRDDDATRLMVRGRDDHGTPVMGVMVADNNGRETVGVAHDASFAGLRIGYGHFGSAFQYSTALRYGANFDVVNNSWGFRHPFMANFNAWSFLTAEPALTHGVTNGRGGLGTVYVFSAGNARGADDDVNHHNYQNSMMTIAVAATDSSGRVAWFSNPGAALTISAPGVGIVTTDTEGGLGYSGNNIAHLSGTSFAAPMVSAAVGLMLDANDRLGWRDVQDILAYSARFNDQARSTWQFNRADDWNGGGMRTSTDYGYGLLDVHAAVRMAETWTNVSNSANMNTATALFQPAQAVAIADGRSLSSTLSIAQDLRVERVEVELNISHARRGDLRVTLVSPEGTSSTLIDRPEHGNSRGSLVFDLTSQQFRGEDSRGTWTLRVEDMSANGQVGSLVSWRLNVFGSAADQNTDRMYTDDFATLTGAGRTVIADMAGLDSINASAVTTASVIDLELGSRIAGRMVSYAQGTIIEKAFAGDASDHVLGNNVANLLWGGRGDDTLTGRGGNDVFAFGVSSGRDTVTDFDAGDRVWLTGGVTLASIQANVATLSDGATVTASNGRAWMVEDFLAGMALASWA